MIGRALLAVVGLGVVAGGALLRRAAPEPTHGYLEADRVDHAGFPVHDHAAALLWGGLGLDCVPFDVATVARFESAAVKGEWSYLLRADGRWVFVAGETLP